RTASLWKILRRRYEFTTSPASVASVNKSNYGLEEKGATNDTNGYECAQNIRDHSLNSCYSWLLLRPQQIQRNGIICFRCLRLLTPVDRPGQQIHAVDIMTGCALSARELPRVHHSAGTRKALPKVALTRCHYHAHFPEHKS